MICIRAFVCAFIACFLGTACGHAYATPNYLAQAAEVQKFIQDHFYEPETGLYAHSLSDRSPDFMWGNGVMFTSLVAASRHDPAYRPIMLAFFDGLDRYWDRVAPIPGYEPSPTNGNGHDKYYDDNQWMVITFVEAYRDTHDARFLGRAQEACKFSLSGWDDTLGGGIWWHEGHKDDIKNTCSNGPGAVACLRLATVLHPDQAAIEIDKARQIADWTIKNLQAENGLFADGKIVTTGLLRPGQLTYNTALILRAELELYEATHNRDYLRRAERMSEAADGFVDPATHAYHDAWKWSHLMVEADLETFAVTKNRKPFQRAADTVAFLYKTWKSNPPDELIENASLARALWLLGESTAAKSN